MKELCPTRFLGPALAAAVLLAGTPALAAETPPATGAVAAPQEVVEDLYRLVSFPAGETPDWDRVRSHFIEDAVIVLRTSREETTVFSVDSFIQDFVEFASQDAVREAGFQERILRKRAMVFRDIAHVLVLYEAHVLGSPRPPQQGVDSIQLVHANGRWKIAAITNEIPTPGHPLPPELAGEQ